MTTVFTFDDVPFGQRLAETIAWCADRARIDDPKKCLRTDELRPWLVAPDRRTAVHTLLRNRDQTMFPALPRPVETRDQMNGGRLLVYFPDANLSCGGAETASQGYFDLENTPPWDTWVALGRNPVPKKHHLSYGTYLISWVPAVFVELASVGMRVNPEECIAWLEDVDVDARTELKHLIRT